MDNLANAVASYRGFERGGEDLAYALLVIAREGWALVRDLRYYADVKAGDPGTPLALAQLGAALASMGDQPRAGALFAQAQARLDAESEPFGSVWRADYWTERRDAAAILTLVVEAGSGAVDAGRLASEVGPATGPASTQEAGPGTSTARSGGHAPRRGPAAVAQRARHARAGGAGPRASRGRLAPRGC